MTLPDFSQSRIVVVGDLMLDRYFSGATSRISPEAPVPVVKVNDNEDRPGGAANVAINAAALGAQVTVIGLCGAQNGKADEAAKILETALGVHSINCRFDYVDGMDTITKLRVMSRNQQLLRLDFEESFAAVPKSGLLEQVRAVINDCDVLILSDYAKGTLSHSAELVALAKQCQVPVVVDPKGTDFTPYRGATIITPNLDEFTLIKGTFANENELAEKAQALRSELELDALLLTRSEQGMSLFSTNPTYHLPAKAKEVYDVTGAGDTVIATLATAIGSGVALNDACVLANHAASIVVGKLGTSTVSPTELALSLQAKVHEDVGVMNAEQLTDTVRRLQSQGKKIVMTNGCFDILHAGHVSYLQAAAQLGDRLIVAVNADASVTRLKGEGRPVNNINRRMAVLAGLGAVDFVVPFSEDTPQALIAQVLPDILVKGGDYTIAEIAGGAEVIANGGSVQVMHFEEGVSTTAIIKQIVDQA
ncbi:bifunctional D-glycero-beta-D-manno-heptose-7-phosphate kinase/D-glycero-beta-D-manno-heptose 1-phosphate adenylyltransferase HldE [Opacimonas viscosa]|uniref:Bifunctional protein HldE n=1 Tax=Opacimonas viscosa TaxID=2961944 RepID=A0AA42BLK1_9ALTE|nr:bifunctional D-glycero-beta-D-manno-heptose-7-phosphate kinase/D-glycero-beta-D-manno-heptose 1-phosphate adenylyltransferase HldE [Opacimonas viscosa]MCP3428890.1 bifunctional D-glycero-beta-D-manno-heptose-7-phosphate kinase/D-glycero-beta-D-manno-heptose 1-phosphate adenylyltransferase HldE [Opacimonas viscosa]